VRVGKRRGSDPAEQPAIDAKIAGGGLKGVHRPEMVELQLEDVAYGGAGVGRSAGKVHFVPFTMPGERVLAEVFSEKKRFSEGRLAEILEASPERIQPKCEYFGVCGGCAYQHVPYALQLRWKQSQVRSLFERIGGIPDAPVEEVVPSPLEWNYRNRIRLHVGEGRIGFFAKYGRSVVDIHRCEIADESLNLRLAALRKSRLRDGEVLLDERMDKRFFEQTNSAAAEQLVAIVVRLLAPGATVLVDAYCGAGFFGHRLANRFSKVVGIESNRAAVAEAVRAAGPAEQYVCGDVASELSRILDLHQQEGVVLLLDPPASGLGQGVAGILGHRAVRQIIYVSCDPATQARDVKELLAKGYRMETVVPLDMFPQTADVEVVTSILPSC
jgi:23S rRNA (uracil1939-C5)-methyltransferase